MVWSYQEVYISLKASGRILNGGSNQFDDCTQEGGSSLWRDGEGHWAIHWNKGEQAMLKKIVNMLIRII